MEREIKEHPQYTDSDYEYLRNKGYTNDEIVHFRDRDRKTGKEPLVHKPIPDIVGRLTVKQRTDRPR